MKLKKEFITHLTGAEAVLVPTGKADFSGMVRGNKTFGAILDLLKEETTESKIVSDLKARFDAPDGAIEKDVAKAIAELREIGAIED